MKFFGKGKKTILKRLLIPIMGILLVQGILYTAVFLQGGVVSQTARNSFDILNERVINRKMYIEDVMVHRWSSFEEEEIRILKSIEATLYENGATIEDIDTNSALNEKVIGSLAQDLIYMLRKNAVTGAFVILDGTALKDDPGGKSRAGLYIRDLDPTSYSGGNSDLLIECGLPSISKALNISLDRYWKPSFQFSREGTGENEKFFFAPLVAAREAGARTSTNYGYWSPPFSLSDKDSEVITYSIPLIAKNGTVFGVMGIDITQSHMFSLLKYDEIGVDKTGAYFMGITREGSSEFQRVFSNGPVYKANFGEADIIAGKEGSYKNVLEFAPTKGGDDIIYGSVQTFHLYNAGTPFENQQWALIGLVKAYDLLRFSNSIKNMVYISTLLSLLMGIAGVYIASGMITRPITKLVSYLKQSDPNEPILLDKINIEEIDALTVSIEELSCAVAESASKISKIIEMTNIPVGVFEYNHNSEKVFCSRNWFVLMEAERLARGDNYITKEDFNKEMFSLEEFLADKGKSIFRIPCGEEEFRWLQLTYFEDEKRILGVVQDITKDINEKKKMEYERDYDVLTDLYNRRAFEQRSEELFANKGKLKTAALIMWDLDNLKHLNDTFGHACGDQYIHAFSENLKVFNHRRGIAARRSGDEFYVLLYGYDSREQIISQIQTVWKRIQRKKLILPNGENLKIRVSAGIAWYPQDAGSYEELIRHADFAMYSAKHTRKGNIQEFDINTYQNNSVLVNGTEAINKLIENQLIRYALQPIIEVSTGKVYGYEMLMRSQIAELQSPSDILRLARSQSKLHKIERLTFFRSMETFKKLVEEGKIPLGTKVFVNSIGSQIMTDPDIIKFKRIYQDYLKYLVVELTESEPYDSEYTRTKVQIVKNWDCMIAIDDFGSGYSSESVLIFLSPDLVKVDISIVRDIDKDVNRQSILENLIAYARKRNIKILAEGVETREEMEVLMFHRVDYMQGYYFGRPEFEVHPIDASVLEEMHKIYKRTIESNE